MINAEKRKCYTKILKYIPFFILYLQNHDAFSD